MTTDIRINLAVLLIVRVVVERFVYVVVRKRYV